MDKLTLVIYYLDNTELDDHQKELLVHTYNLCNEYRLNRIIYMKNKIYLIDDEVGSYSFWCSRFFSDYIKCQYELNRLNIDKLYNSIINEEL